MAVFLCQYTKTGKHTKSLYSLYIFLKSSKKIFFCTKNKKMLFCCIIDVKTQ